MERSSGKRTDFAQNLTSERDRRGETFGQYVTNVFYGRRVFRWCKAFKLARGNIYIYIYAEDEFRYWKVFVEKIKITESSVADGRGIARKECVSNLPDERWIVGILRVEIRLVLVITISVDINTMVYDVSVKSYSVAFYYYRKTVRRVRCRTVVDDAVVRCSERPSAEKFPTTATPAPISSPRNL